MRKLVIILIVFLAVITFIRAFDYPGNINLNAPSGNFEKTEDGDL